MKAPLLTHTALKRCVMIAARAYEAADRHNKNGLIEHAAQCMEQAVMDIITEYENSKLSGEETFLGREVSELER